MQTTVFRAMLRSRILEILDAWPAQDQYAIMFFIYPNESCEYNGYHNIPEFSMLFKCESAMGSSRNPFFHASGDDEERWNPAFWDHDLQQSVIRFDEQNPMADALIDWYETIGVQDIGVENPSLMFDSSGMYIGKGPNGLAEFLQLVADIAAELQNSGIIHTKFGKSMPIILADFECTWYMVKATCHANPNGEANEYIDACLRQNWVSEAQIQQ